MIQIVKDFDGSYYANINVNGDIYIGLPEYGPYKTLKAAVKEQLDIVLPNLDTLKWMRCGRKYFATIR